MLCLIISNSNKIERLINGFHFLLSMERQIEAIIFFIPIIISVLATLFYGINGINKNQKIKNLIVQIGIINLVIFLLGGIFWFFTMTDGLSQVMGVAIYGGVFLVIEIIASLIFYFVSKH